MSQLDRIERMLTELHDAADWWKAEVRRQRDLKEIARAEADELRRQRDLKEVKIKRLQAWRRAVCAKLGIKVRASFAGAVMEITKLQARPRS